jgi:hypothetical protein
VQGLRARSRSCQKRWRCSPAAPQVLDCLLEGIASAPLSADLTGQLRALMWELPLPPGQASMSLASLKEGLRGPRTGVHDPAEEHLGRVAEHEFKIGGGMAVVPRSAGLRLTVPRVHKGLGRKRPCPLRGAYARKRPVCVAGTQGPDGLPKVLPFELSRERDLTSGAGVDHPRRQALAALRGRPRSDRRHG